MSTTEMTAATEGALDVASIKGMDRWCISGVILTLGTRS